MPNSRNRKSPPIFSSLRKFLPTVSERFASKNPDLCACAVLISLDQLPVKLIHQISNEIVAGGGSDSEMPAIIEIATSANHDRDLNVSSEFRAIMTRLDIAVSPDEAWELLAKVGAKHAREVLSAVVAGNLDPIEGAITVSSIFYDYLQDEDRKRLCYKNQPAPSSIALCLLPFVEFYSVPDELYNAGFNVNAWNDALPYAPANTMSGSEKDFQLNQLRTKYMCSAEGCLKNIS